MRGNFREYQISRFCSQKFASKIFHGSYTCNTQDVNTGDTAVQGCEGCRQSDSCISVISVSIDYFIHTCTQFNQHFMKKSFKFFKYFNLLHTVYFMTCFIYFFNKINYCLCFDYKA